MRGMFESDRDMLLQLAGEEHTLPALALPTVVEKLGLLVTRKLLPGKHQLGYLDLDAMEITLCLRSAAKVKPRPRKREYMDNFSLAHELGHFRLHQEEIITGTVGDREELEADQYAAAFLVPGPRLEQSSQVRLMKRLAKRDGMRPNHIWGNIYELSEQFRVTPAAMRWVLFDFGLVTDSDPVELVATAEPLPEKRVDVDEDDDDTWGHLKAL